MNRWIRSGDRSRQSKLNVHSLKSMTLFREASRPSSGFSDIGHPAVCYFTAHALPLAGKLVVLDDIRVSRVNEIAVSC
jgi:hypothetical protein